MHPKWPAPLSAISASNQNFTLTPGLSSYQPLLAYDNAANGPRQHALTQESCHASCSQPCARRYTTPGQAPACIQVSFRCATHQHCPKTPRTREKLPACGQLLRDASALCRECSCSHLEELLRERLHGGMPPLALQQAGRLLHGGLHVGLRQAVEQALHALCEPLRCACSSSKCLF